MPNVPTVNPVNAKRAPFEVDPHPPRLPPVATVVLPRARLRSVIAEPDARRRDVKPQPPKPPRNDVAMHFAPPRPLNAPRQRRKRPTQKGPKPQTSQPSSVIHSPSPTIAQHGSPYPIESSGQRSPIPNQQKIQAPPRPIPIEARYGPSRRATAFTGSTRRGACTGRKGSRRSPWRYSAANDPARQGRSAPR